MTQQDPDRRHLLRSLAGAPSLVAPGLAAPLAARAQAAPDTGLAAATMGLIAADICQLTPAVTQGPFYLDPKLLRRDITEGLPGVPLRLGLQMVTAACRPVAGARVDLWHCDAQGNYSGFARQGSDAARSTEGQHFLRGTQHTDAQGIVTFDTLYPGWYRGRTPHLHYKVFLDDRTVLTGQVFFPDALSQYLYEHAPAYRRAEPRDTANAADGIAAEAGEGAHCAIREQRDRYVAALVVGIDPTAEWRERGPFGGGPPGFRPGGPPPFPPPGPTSGGAPDGRRPPPGGRGVDPARIRMFPGGG